MRLFSRSLSSTSAFCKRTLSNFCSMVAMGAPAATRSPGCTRTLTTVRWKPPRRRSFLPRSPGPRHVLRPASGPIRTLPRPRQHENRHEAANTCIAGGMTLMRGLSWSGESMRLGAVCRPRQPTGCLSWVLALSCSSMIFAFEGWTPSSISKEDLLYVFSRQQASAMFQPTGPRRNCRPIRFPTRTLGS